MPYNLPPHPHRRTHDRLPASRLPRRGTTTSTCLADGLSCRKVHAALVGSPWTLAFGYHEHRTPTHGYAATREAAMAAVAKSWRRE